VRAIVEKQRDAGIDVGNNGEQQRDSFFLYLKGRLSGLGGSWERPSRADVDRYPEFKRMWTEQHASKTQVSALGGLPKAVGEVRYLDDRAINDECRHFKAVLDEQPDAFVEPFSERAIAPGIPRHGGQSEALRHARGLLGGARQRRCRSSEGDRARHGFLLQIDAPDLALDATSPQGQAGRRVRRFRRAGGRDHQPGADRRPRERARLHVCWGNSESPHDSDVPLADILPTLQQAKVGGFVLPFANPRHAHEFRCFEKFPLAGDQVLVAGVIDSLTNFVEHPEVVADRIERVAAVIGDRSRVLAGTDCGFDTSAGWGRVAEDVVWAKLASLRDGARLASQRLFK
jgi:5-methyltetrahydropteroyltriglutamate--homocysteine methyltransferase